MQIRPLLRRCRPVPDESLPSYLVRLSRFNYYDQAKQVVSLYRLAPNKYLYNSVSKPSTAEMFFRLRTLTQLSSVELYALTLHRLAPTLTPIGRATETLEFADFLGPKLSGTQNRRVRSDQKAQFCPECQDGEIRHRLTWFAKLTTVCLEHRLLLQDTCPGCGSFVQILSVAEGACGRCGTNLALAPRLSVADDCVGLSAQAAVQRWLLGAALELNDLNLPKASPQALCELLTVLRNATLRLGAEWPFIHHNERFVPTFRKEMRANQKNPTQAYLLMVAAFKALINWPDGFHAFLDAFRASSLAEGVANSFGTLHSVFLARNWQNSKMVFVQDAYRNYLLTLPARDFRHAQRFKNYVLPITSRDTVNFTEASRLLGVTTADIRRLVAAGIFSPAVKGMNKGGFLYRRDIVEARDRWNKTLSYKEASALLKLPVKWVRRLLTKGFIQAELGPKIDGSQQWKLTQSSIGLLVQQIAARVVLLETDSSPPFKTLRSVAAELGKYSGDDIDILHELLSGRIQPYSTTNNPFNLDALRFRTADVRLLKTLWRAAQTLLDVNEVRELLNVSEKIYARWLKLNLLKPVKADSSPFPFYTTHDVAAFRAKYISIGEIVVVTAHTLHELQAWMKHSHLDHLMVPGSPEIAPHRTSLFCREATLHFLDKYISLHETKRFLHLERKDVMKLIKSKKLTPVNEHFWFSRQSVMLFNSNQVYEH